MAWTIFQTIVYTHIKDYAVKQYGDDGDDPVTDYSADDCVRNMKKYIARHGKNARPDQDKLDLIKIAHYAQMAHDKLESNDAHEN